MIILQWVRFILAAILLLGGMVTLLATIVGMFRFRYVMNRIHFAAKCDTFGVMLTISSLILMLGWDVSSLKLLLILVFIWLANPLSGHLIARLESTINPDVIKEECEVIHHDTV